jgi:hypothetical protein
MANGQPVAPTVATRRLGIGGKLLAAFGAIAALTVAASVVAWILFANIREDLAIIADESLPEIASSFRLAEESARISAAIPHLITVESPSDAMPRRSLMSSIRKRRLFAPISKDWSLQFSRACPQDKNVSRYSMHYRVNISFL